MFLYPWRRAPWSATWQLVNLSGEHRAAHPRSVSLDFTPRYSDPSAWAPGTIE